MFTFAGEYDDCFTGTKKKAKSVVRIINENKHVMEMYDYTPEGREFKNMEVVYTRRGTQAVSQMTGDAAASK